MKYFMVYLAVELQYTTLDNVHTKKMTTTDFYLHAHILPTPHLFHKVVAQIYILYLISKLFSARESKRTTVNTYRQGSYN